MGASNGPVPHRVTFVTCAGAATRGGAPRGRTCPWSVRMSCTSWAPTKQGTIDVDEAVAESVRSSSSTSPSLEAKGCSSSWQRCAVRCGHRESQQRGFLLLLMAASCGHADRRGSAIPMPAAGLHAKAKTAHPSAIGLRDETMIVCYGDAGYFCTGRQSLNTASLVSPKRYGDRRPCRVMVCEDRRRGTPVLVHRGPLQAGSRLGSVVELGAHDDCAVHWQPVVVDW